MVQEVQTEVGIYDETMLETIEAVGTSSRKIIEWRQTVWGHNVSGCSATGNVTWHYRNGVTDEDSYYVKSQDLDIDSSWWGVDYVMKNGCIRLPKAWAYQCTLTWWGGAAWWDTTVFVELAGKVLYTNTFSGSTQTETVTFTFNAGKFDLLELGWEFYVTGSYTQITLRFSQAATLEIQQL